MKTSDKRLATIDKKFMSRCLQLAQLGAGRVSPNPMVGAVVVKGGRVLAEGYHRYLGGPHAEIEALKKIQFKAKGATLYCNLEPCCHQGRTPPCVGQIINSGIKRVVIAHRDPNPKVSGKSIRLLKKSNIQVKEGVLKKEARVLNRFFLTWVTKKRPYVILKVAASLDGKIAALKGNQTWLTGPQADKRVHGLRSKVDGILVGVNTILSDNPQLNVRGIKGSRQPARIVLDSRLRTPLTSKIFQSKGGLVYLVCGVVSSSTRKKIEKKGAQILRFDPVGATRRVALNRVSIPDLLEKLASKSITSLMVEGGGEVNSQFLNSGLVDELIYFVSPTFLGGQALDAFPNIDLSKKQRPIQLRSRTLHGEDIEMRYIF